MKVGALTTASMEPQVKTAENRNVMGRLIAYLNCFNGAASKNCGKPAKFGMMIDIVAASMEPQVKTAENQMSRMSQSYHSSASMEPQVKPAENVVQLALIRSTATLQWSRK